MIKRILSIAGKPGLFKLVNQGKNMLIVESLSTGKRTPAYPHEKVISLADISIYTTEGDEPLAEVLEKVAAKAEKKPIDIKGFANDAAIRAYFAEILPAFDDERVYTTDIKKLFQWYNLLISAGITEFVEKKESETEVNDEQKAEKA